jgi:hypothetical protein
VVLHFAETYHREPGRRVFDVFLNGRLILSDLDVFEEAGDRAFAAVVRSGEVKAYEEIEVGFRGHEGAPILNGIEVLQVTEEDLE